VIRCVERVSGRPVPFRIAGRRAGDTARLVATSERAQQELGWTPEHSGLESIVESAWAWHQEHPEGYAD
jgi:UDP-glucose 4-epimerase